MASFFVYMCWIILFKWCINWEAKEFSPPSLITVLVDFVLNAGSISKDETQLYESTVFQECLQLVLFSIMFLSVPTMLFAKPVILYLKNKKNETGRVQDDVL